MGKVLFSQVSVCSQGGWVPHLHPIILPLVPNPSRGGTLVFLVPSGGYHSPRWVRGTPVSGGGGIPVAAGTPVPGQDGVAPARRGWGPTPSRDGTTE